MLSNEEKEITGILRKLNDQDIAFTVDVLGETVVSEKEADDYAKRYLELMQFLRPETSKWPACKSNQTASVSWPALNLSVKISALYSQISPADPETAIREISKRLRPLLQRARELGAFINFDMEHYALKDLTLELFKRIFGESEFAESPKCGLALQAYLKDCEADLNNIIDWSRKQNHRLTVRLVKGAYWDYETTMAEQ